ncbi:uncharacterized protein BYT42DRAFT_562303 [Radiomyces spectabilis]|uniref:uncharacterized protein n=1 Tax=Radiomyces spectabilis TaxID=64574 RepID=UPI00221FDCDD|nr:uncharacterized protein BYT42DRAFT_562303 [Radiomyces spectabilis]KAI8384381.1 hypothetical protein BYT42DRAFT_562303 [Radiomyces spectabilis]
MGQAKSKENRVLAQKTHFSPREISHLRQNVEASSSTKNTITEDVFKETVKKYVPSVTSSDDVFLKRLYAAFDVDNNNSIEFSEFVDGLSVFMKGSPEEKLALSFKLYDVNRDGYLTRGELERVMLQLATTCSEEDQTNDIKGMIARMFEDLDVDGDGRLSFEEYKLSAMKEPLVVDFLEQFLAEHNLSSNPPMPSRPASVRSYRSNRSLTPNNRSPGSPSSPSNQSRLSVRLSQAELLEYSHQQQRLNSVPTSPTTSSHSPKSNPSPPSPIMKQHGLSRPTSMASLDAALTSMDLDTDKKNPRQQLSPQAPNPHAA